MKIEIDGKSFWLGCGIAFWLSLTTLLLSEVVA